MSIDVLAGVLHTLVIGGDVRVVNLWTGQVQGCKLVLFAVCDDFMSLKFVLAWDLTQPSLDASRTDQRSVTAPTHLGAIQSLTQDPCLSHVDSPKITPTNVIY